MYICIVPFRDCSRCLYIRMLGMSNAVVVRFIPAVTTDEMTEIVGCTSLNCSGFEYNYNIDHYQLEVAKP